MKLFHILAIMAIEAVLLCAGVSVASRNSSGTMTGINGPYTAGSVISSSIINARLADIESEITDSASRSGKGGFTAPVRGADGTATAPTYSFTSETTAGLFRNAAADLRMTFNGTLAQRWTSSNIYLSLPISGNVGIGAAATYPLDVQSQVGFTTARFLPTTASTVPLAIINNTSVSDLGLNVTHDGANWKYGVTGFAHVIEGNASSGGIFFLTAPSGTGGNTATMTERMRINATDVITSVPLTTTNLKFNALIVQAATGGGTKALSGGTATQTIASGLAQCVCTDTTANASVKCSLAGTTLTLTGTGTDVIAYLCF